MPDERGLLAHIYSALVRPHLEYAIQANCPYLKNDIYHLERMRRGRNEVGEGLRDLNYEERDSTH